MATHKRGDWVVSVCVGRKVKSFAFPNQRAARAFQRDALKSGAKCASVPAKMTSGSLARLTS